MRESCTYGSVRGAPSNGRPYRDPGIGVGDYEAMCEFRLDLARHGVLSVRSSHRSASLFSKVSACLEIFDQPHEALILMVLMVAMKQRRTRVVGDEIDFRRSKSDHVERVFHQPRCRLVVDLGHLEGMPVKVDRVCVSAIVFHDEGVAFATFDREQRVCVRP